MRAFFVMRLPIVAAVVAAAAFSTWAPRARAADDATAQARSHYEMGLRLFDAREHEQALVEFQAANDLKTRPAALFMMAQCEYLLGRLKEARAHYERYASENPTGEFVELAKDRIQSIDKRASTFVINTVPDGVVVRIRAEVTLDGPPGATDLSGQAPNNFQIPRGRYRIDVMKENYQGQTRVVDVDIAETKPLFFKLDPIPARLEIATVPAGATLYVNGNRARNPYRQDVAPGHVEIFAEAQDYEGKTVDLTLAPGERKRLLGPDSLRLAYAQRSGRPELIVASAVMGAFVGAGAVAAAIGSDLQSPNVASVSLVIGGGIVGVIGGAVVATPLVPRYIPDNRALFILGSMWMGGVEGVAAGVIWQQINAPRATPAPQGDASNPCPSPGPCRPPLGVELRAGFIGSLPGLALGLTAGSLLADRAPTYGRVALIQSAALGGLLAGALAQMAVQWNPYGSYWEYSVQDAVVSMKNATAPGGINCRDDGTTASGLFLSKCAFKDTSVLDLTPGALIGLNVGLLAGLAAAYLPDQSRYGPTWKRVVLVDLAAGAGALAGGLTGCVANKNGCLDSDPLARDRAIVGASALAGGAIGLLGGILLSRHIDDEPQAPSTIASTLMLMPTPAPRGGSFPGLSAMAAF